MTSESPLWILSSPVTGWDWKSVAGLPGAQLHEKVFWEKSAKGFKGYLLKELVDQSIKSLPPDQKSQIDLIVLSDSAGQKVYLPRALTVKYPILMTYQKDLIAPVLTRPRILEEGLPVTRYFLKEVQKIELTSYLSLFQALMLKKRSDPLAVRGEKIFIYSCISCHASGQKPEAKDLAFKMEPAQDLFKGHQKIKEVPKYSERDTRSLLSYFAAIRSEQALKTALR